jgi:hypothetical protein
MAELMGTGIDSGSTLLRWLLPHQFADACGFIGQQRRGFWSIRVAAGAAPNGRVGIAQPNHEPFWF